MPFVLSGAADLLAASGNHPYVRHWLDRADEDLRVWASRGALVWSVRGRDDEGDVVAFGPPRQVADLLAGVAGQLPSGASLSVPRDVVPLLGPVVAQVDPVEWEFRWTARQPPATGGEAEVVDLPVDAEPEVAVLLERASRRPEVRPGDPMVRGWVGVRGEAGALVAVAADTSGSVGYFSAVATDPVVRRRGWGAAVTTALTRRLLKEFGVCSLALYSDNDAARRVYVKLGYDGEVLVTTGTLAGV